MPQKFQMTDYEPLSRTGNSRSRGEESDPDEFPVSSVRKEKALESREVFVSGGGSSEEHVHRPRLKVVLKRGHALSFACLFLFTVIVYFRPYELSTSLSFLSNSAFWVAIFTLIVFVLTQLGLEGKITVRPREVNMVFLLAVAGVLSIPLALDKELAWATLVDYLKVLLMFIVMVNVVRTEKRLRALILLALFTSFVVSLSAVNDYSLGNLAMGQKERIRGVLGNMFENPNDLALFLVTMVPIAFAMFLGTKALSKKLLYVSLVLLFAAGIVCTTSRGGFIGLACVMGVLGWKLARRNRALIGGIALALILALAFIGPGGLKTRLEKGSDDASAVNRTDDLKRSIFLMVRHPLFGLGMSNYALYSNTAHATHNAYTQVGAEMGIPALLFYILFLVTPIRRLARIRRSEETLRRNNLYYLSIGIETSLIGYMVTSFFLSVAYMWYAYFLVGYAITLSRLIKPDDFLETAGKRDSLNLPHSPTARLMAGDLSS